MRHRKAGHKFGRSSAHRVAMTRNQVMSLLKHERITTTETKAKELRRWAERVITAAKADDLHARRQLAPWLNHDRDLMAKLFSTYVPRFSARDGGYTRLIQVGPRHGDAAPMVMIELLPEAAPAK